MKKTSVGCQRFGEERRRVRDLDSRAPLVFCLTLFLLQAAPAFPRGPGAFREGKKDPRVIFVEAAKEFDRGSLGKAETLLREALKRDRGFEKARYQLALTLHLMGQDEAALEELTRIRKENDTLRLASSLRGEILLKLSRWQEALVAWQGVPSDNVDQRALRLQGLAKTYEGMGKNADAAEAWTGYLELQVRPGSFLFRQIAANRVKAGEREKAILFCENSPLLRVHASLSAMCKAQVFHSAFEVSRSQEDRRKALEAIQEAVKKDERNLEAIDLLERWKVES